MNIYSYFNSKDIAEYCKSINYKFSAIESAFIVWYSNHHNIKEKHKAWRKIIDTMPDEQFPNRWSLDNYTLHSFLETYMKLQNEFIDDFRENNENYIYTSEILYSGDDEYNADYVFYDDYGVCIDSIKQQISNDKYDNIEKIKIVRHFLRKKVFLLDKVTEIDNVQAEIIFSNKLLPEELNVDYGFDDERRLLQAPYGFYSMWIAVPIPFQKGDIVTSSNGYNRISGKHEPFVLELIPWWRRNMSNNDIKENALYWNNFGVDSSDMVSCAWFQDFNGELFLGHKYCYLDLEYYNDRFEGTESLLIAVSNCIKGKITIEELLRSHSIILMSNYAEEMRKYFNQNDKLLRACGIEYGKESEGKIK